MAGVALAHPDEHACDGRGGKLNPSGRGLNRAEEVGGNVHCDFDDGGGDDGGGDTGGDV